MQQGNSILTEPRDWLPLILPGMEGVSVKVYSIDKVNHRAVVKVRFDYGTSMPRQMHHCYVVAYTIAGSWACDKGFFDAGDVACGKLGDNPRLRGEQNAELLVVLDSPDGQYIDTTIPDGTILHLGERWLKALEGLGLEEYRQLDQLALVDRLPTPRRVA